MEPQKKNSKLCRNIFVLAFVVVAAAVVVWRTMPHSPAFCFDFSHDMQFGDRKVDHPVNMGFGGPGGIMYYIPEVPALQAALKKQGFYIDPFENTGGNIYAAAFFGPSTKSAVLSFQKKYGLPQTGQVTNDTIDKLSALYKCPTSTPVSVATISIATTTPKSK